MTRRYLPTLGEGILEFSAIGSDTITTVVEVPPLLAWVGPSPRLTTQDEATSYLHINRLRSDGYDQPMAGVQLSRFPNLSNSLFHAQVRLEASSSQYFDAYVFDAAGNIAYAYFGPVVPGGWATYESIALEMIETAGPSIAPVWAAAIGPYFAPGAEVWDVSWLAVSEEGAIPTRVYPRADGLGMGAPRIMDNRSPYRSPRVFGMI